MHRSKIIWCGFKFDVELDEENELQINMSGVAIGFAENDKKDDIKIKDSSTGKYTNH